MSYKNKGKVKRTEIWANKRSFNCRKILYYIVSSHL